MGAGIALLGTVPFAALLAKPLASVMFVRTSAHDGNWGYVFMIMLIILAPATYALFFATAGELLKNRVSQAVHTSTMRIAAVGILPYLVLVVSAIAWESGPQRTMLIVAALTVPMAMMATIAASGRTA